MTDKLIATAKTTTNPQMYREFFRMYYKEKTRGVVIATTLIGAIAVLFGLYALAAHMQILYAAIPLAAGVVLIVKPRYAYSRPYRAAKDNKITTKYEFYEDGFIEIGTASRDEFLYSSMYKLKETQDYLYIYHNRENVSVVDKSKIKPIAASELSQLLRSNIPY